jgi:nucleoside-diphosphate-sugar epimerase
MKPTLLVTGITGFIGKNLKQLILDYRLEEKFNVCFLSSINDNIFPTILHNNYSFSKNDFYLKNINHVDILLHMGSFIPKSSIDANNLSLSISNIINTQKLLNELPSIPSKIVFLSTVDVYGDSKVIINEETYCKPSTLYGWSKLYIENYIKSYSLLNKTQYKILRIGHTYGEGEEFYKKIIPITFKKILYGQSPELYGNPDELRSFLFAKDACKFIIKSISEALPDGIINIVNDQSISLINLLQLMLNIANSDLKINILNDSNVLKRDLFFDNSKMRTILGNPETSLETGLALEYNYLLKLKNENHF